MEVNAALPSDSRCAIGLAPLLELFDGSSEAVLRLLEVASNSIFEDLGRIVAASSARDFKGVAHAAHRLKGTSSSIGATRLNDLGSSIEHAALYERFAALPSLVDDLRAAVDSISTAIATYASDAAPVADQAGPRDDAA